MRAGPTSTTTQLGKWEKEMAADIRIGTSGWHYKYWIGRYYPEDLKPADMLAADGVSGAILDRSASDLCSDSVSEGPARHPRPNTKTRRPFGRRVFR
jgi:hypothetical protein